MDFLEAREQINSDVSGALVHSLTSNDHRGCTP